MVFDDLTLFTMLREKRKKNSLTQLKRRLKIEIFAAILAFALIVSVFVFPLASALVRRPPNWSFEEGTLGSVPDGWVMRTQDYTSSPPPTSTYIHEVSEVGTQYFSGGRSCWLHSRVVDTDGTVLARYSWTWIEPDNWIYEPDATHVRFLLRDIQPTHSLFWGWNDEIWLGFNDSVTQHQTHIYNNGETLNFNYYNDTKVGADGATWYEYVYPIPADINRSHMKVQIICIAGDWTFYSTSNFADMSFYVDDVEILYEPEWPMFNHDLQRTGFSTSTAPDKNYTKWIYSTGHWIIDGPAVASGRVYFGSDDQTLYCLNSSSGNFIWNYKVGGSPISCPAIADDRVYIGSADRRVYCLNATTGAFIWSYTTGQDVRSSPAVSNGKIYFGSADHKVYCLNASTGTHVWNYTAGNQVTSSPAVVDDKVFFGSVDNNAYCLNATNGAYIWSYYAGGSVSSPAVVDNRVYFEVANGQVYCLNALTGTYIWNYAAGSYGTGLSPSVAYGNVYVGSGDCKVYCLNAASGAFVWSYTTGNWVRSSPALSDGKVYIGSLDHNIYCLNATSGNRIWSYTTGNWIYASPAVAYGNVYVASMDGGVYCFGPPPPYTLVITTNSGGTTDPSPGTLRYSEVTIVTVSASPYVNYAFDHWELDGSDAGTANPVSITMDTHHSLRAVFKIDWWPMFHHDLQHTGYSNSLAPNTNKTKWSFTTGNVVESSPAVVDDRVFVGSNDFNLYCLNATTGGEIWRYAASHYIMTGPSVAEGRVYVGTGDWYVHCLNATNGAHIWSYRTGQYVASSPAISDGKVYFGSADYNFYCLNASTGAYIWSYATGHQVGRSSPAVVNDRVYFGSWDHKVYCLNATTGTYIWSFTTGDIVESSPAVVENRVFIGSDDRSVYCLNASTGGLIWSYGVNGSVMSSPAVASGRVFVGSWNSHEIYCLNASTGAYIWSYATGHVIWGSPAIADGKVYIGSHDQKLYCLNASDGAFIWSYLTDGILEFSSPAVANGAVYIGSMGGKVYAFSDFYDVAVNAHCNSEGADVSVSITMDGSPTGYTTPNTFTHLTGTHTFTVSGTDAGSHPFREWSTGSTSTTITVDSQGTYTAYYQANYTLTITTTAGGTTNPAPGTYTYWSGTAVDVSETPYANYRFDYWELDGSSAGSASTIRVTMNANHALKAHFVYSPPVGGVALHIDKFGLLEPYIASSLAIIVAAVAATVYVRWVKGKRTKH